MWEAGAIVLSVFCGVYIIVFPLQLAMPPIYPIQRLPIIKKIPNRVRSEVHKIGRYLPKLRTRKAHTSATKKPPAGNYLRDEKADYRFVFACTKLVIIVYSPPRN